MKKLLYITTNLQNSGGVARILSVKLNYLIETFNYNISVINSNQNEDNFFYDFNTKIKFYDLNTKNLIRYKKELNEIICKVKPHIIINCDNGLKGSLLPYLIITDAALIYERHCSKNISVSSFKERFKLKLSNLLLQKSLNKYHNFIVLNDEEKKDWNDENVQVITNPLWLDVSKKKNTTDYKIVVAVGRQSYEKRYDKLIDIWKKVIDKNPNWLLRIYGEKNNQLPLDKLVLEKNLENNIQIYSPINDVEKIYSEASMLLSTSESEAFGLVLIEAMAFGRPVIAFEETSGSKTIIKNGENGFLIKSNDLKTYVQKINLLIKDKDLRFKMGENAKKSVRKYNLINIMKQWQDLFNSI